MGGSRTQIENFPSHVSVMFKKYPMCGGSVIDELHIVTAACCVVHYHGVFYSNLVVVTSEDDLDNISPDNIYSVSLVTFHKDYLPRDLWVHDIAILTVNINIYFIKFILTNKIEIKTFIYFSAYKTNNYFIKKFTNTIINSKITFRDCLETSKFRTNLSISSITFFKISQSIECYSCSSSSLCNLS